MIVNWPRYIHVEMPVPFPQESEKKRDVFETSIVLRVLRYGHANGLRIGTSYGATKRSAGTSGKHRRIPVEKRWPLAAYDERRRRRNEEQKEEERKRKKDFVIGTRIDWKIGRESLLHKFSLC